MKKRVFLILILVLLMALTACGHEHTWQAASCVSPKMCPECGETEGEALGHNWVDATCTEAKMCAVCLQTVGEPAGHDWVDATCTEAMYCAICKKTEGEPLGHEWIPADCVTAEKCTVCGLEQGAPVGHEVKNWVVTKASSCTETGTETGTCSLCAEVLEREIEKKDHVPGEWETTVQPTIDEEGRRVRSCINCKKELESEAFELSDEEIERLYKNSCKSISYDKLARSPGEYEGEYVKFSGRVVQVCSEASSNLYYSTYRVAVSGSYNSVVFLYVDNYGSGERILEDDWITFYGEFDGLYSYTTVMGAQVTIPSVKAEYVD